MDLITGATGLLGSHIAEQLARGGLDHAIALLKWDQDATNAKATPDYDSYEDRWGYLNNTGLDGFNGSDVDLHGVFGSSGNDDAQWIQVTDPSSGSIIGQYAVFVEDENGKLNINTAGNATNTSPGAAPLPSTYDDDDQNDYDVSSIFGV